MSDVYSGDVSTWLTAGLARTDARPAWFTASLAAPFASPMTFETWEVRLPHSAVGVCAVMAPDPDAEAEDPWLDALPETEPEAPEAPAEPEAPAPALAP